MADRDKAENEEELDGADPEKRAEERQAALQLKDEIVAKIKIKQENRERNLKPEEFRLSEDQLRRLDGSVKKNTAFQRKLRSLTEQQRANLTSDLKTLNLSKYLVEVASSITEAKLKLADVSCAIHLCTLLHQRYEEFSELLLSHLQRIYDSPITKDDEKSAVISKYRLGLRLTGELVLSGVVNQDVGTSLLLEMLSTVIKADEESHPYLSVMVSFARHFAEDMAGIVPRKQRTLLLKFNIELPQSEFLPSSKKEEVRKLLQSHFASASRHLLKEHKAMHKRERRNHVLLTTKGEIPEDRQAENEAAQKAYDKLLTSMSTLAELLDEDMPDLPEYQAPQEDSDISIELQFPSLGETDESDPNALWEDEDTRQFYEGITDIKPFVPAIVLEERKKSASESTDESPSDETVQSGDQTQEEIDEETMLEQMIRDTEEETAQDEEEDEEEEGEEEEGGVAEPTGEEEKEPGSPAALFELFALRLPTMLNRKLVDELAVEFCMSLNTKFYRKKLARTLYNVEKNRMDLIPFYCRLVATLAPCVDDVAPTLVEILLGELRHQIRKKDQLHIHTKLKNIRCLAELTKFGICSKPEAMKCITLLLRDFTHHHIDMACLFLEHCGRFLLRSPDSHLRAKALLEILLRKKKVQHLDGRQRSLVENALYYANPPEVSQISVVQQPPMQRYIKKLIYKDLNKMNTEKILRQIRKLDWRDLEISLFTISTLSAIWNVKYNNIHCVANLLAGLKTYQEEAVIRVVDTVLEDIRTGLELNLPKLNQCRVSSIKFIGELYNYQLLESNVIFRILYLLLQFGSNPDGTPSLLDPFDSYFRVRLICILLDTCGQYFDRGSSRKRLDAFLVYFQCYLFSKRQPQPLEVEYLVRDAIEALRPQLELFHTPQEAYEAALELEKKYKDKIGNYGEDLAGEESDEEEEQRDNGRGQNKEEEEEEEDDDEMGEGEEEEQTGDNTFEEDPVLKATPALVKCQEDDEFVTAFEKMMTDDLQTRKIENLKVPTLDVAVPMHLKGPGSDKSALIHEEGELRMKFKVMTRKGHKQQLKELNIPLDSDLTTGLRNTRQAKTEDHEEMKQRVLDYERRQEEEAYQAMIADMESKMKPGHKKQASSQPQKKPQYQQHSSTQSHHRYQHGGDREGGGHSQSHGYHTQGRGQGRGGSRRGGGGRGRGWRDGGGNGGDNRQKQNHQTQ